MTRKDYVAIARAFATTRGEAIQGNYACPSAALDALQERITCLLADDNARFDPGRFNAACLKL